MYLSKKEVMIMVIIDTLLGLRLVLGLGLGLGLEFTYVRMEDVCMHPHYLRDTSYL